MTSVDLEELRWAVETLQWVKQRKVEIKEAEERARSAIEEALGENTSGSLDGHEVITWTSGKRTALDQQVLKTAFPDIYETCKRTTDVRRFTVLDVD